MMSAETWAAIAAVFVAIVAVFQTKRSLENQAIHNHKTVLPIPQVTFGDYVNQLHVKLENAGTGPLIVKELLVRDKRNKITKRSVIDVMRGRFSHVLWETFVGKIEGRAIPAQDVLTLIAFNGGTSEVEAIRNALGDLDITVEYTDVYGNSFNAYTRAFDWFHRDAVLRKEEPEG